MATITQTGTFSWGTTNTPPDPVGEGVVARVAAQMNETAGNAHIQSGIGVARRGIAAGCAKSPPVRFFFEWRRAVPGSGGYKCMWGRSVRSQGQTATHTVWRTNVTGTCGLWRASAISSPNAGENNTTAIFELCKSASETGNAALLADTVLASGETTRRATNERLHVCYGVCPGYSPGVAWKRATSPGSSPAWTPVPSTPVTACGSANAAVGKLTMVRDHNEWFVGPYGSFFYVFNDGSEGYPCPP